MTFRDDHDAALARAEALEHEVERERERAQDAERELERMKRELAEAKLQQVLREPEPPPPSLETEHVSTLGDAAMAVMVVSMSLLFVLVCVIAYLDHNS